MKKLLFLTCLVLGLVSSVVADTYKLVDSEFIDIRTKTKANYYNQQIDLSDRSDGGESLDKTLTRVEVKNYMDINYLDIFKVSSTIGYYKNGDAYNKDSDLGEIWLSQEESHLYIEKLYGQLKLAELGEFTLSAVYGIIPLTGGNIKKFSSQDEIQGNGLFTLIDLNLQGGFIVLSNKNHIFKVGHNYWRKDNWQHDEKLIDANDGTKGTFVFYEYQSGKHTVELNYITADVKYKGYDMANAQLYGIGYSYDDSLESGMVYYGILAHSVWNSKMEDVLNMGVFGNATNSIKMANQYYPDQYDFDNDTQTGNSILLGTKYYTELFGHEADIGIEYFKTSKNFSSFNNGSLFYNDYGFWRRRGSDVITLYSDFKVTKNFIVSLKGTFANNKYTAKNGSIADVTSNPATHNFYKKEQTVLLKVAYEF